MSTAMNTMVPHSPIAAELAIPCTPRDVAKKAGRNAAEMPPASTTSAPSNDMTMPAGRSRERTRKTMTAAAVINPTMVPLKRICRNSERSTVAVVMLSSSVGTQLFC